MNKFTDILFSKRDEKYANFQAKLMPTISPNIIIGVRVPYVREIAKKCIKDPETNVFLKELPHKYYDENMLHGLFLSELNNYKETIDRINEFLPYVDCWSVCDIMSPKIFKKYKNELLIEIKKWIASKHTYTCRFGIEMLMSHYLDKDYKKEYLLLPSKIISNEYYINMMIAWFYATALAKQYDDAIKIIENKSLPVWVHNKTIQKAIESYRISKTQKDYLRSLKIK